MVNVKSHNRKIRFSYNPKTHYAKLKIGKIKTGANVKFVQSKTFVGSWEGKHGKKLGDTIFIDKDLRKESIKPVMAHELAERKLRNLGLPLDTAHRIATDVVEKKIVGKKKFPAHQLHIKKVYQTKNIEGIFYP